MDSDFLPSRYCNMCIIIIISILNFSLLISSSNVPFILLHGLGDACANVGPSYYTKLLSSLAGTPGFCLEVGNGALSSWLMPLTQQVEEICHKVKAMPELRNGYNIVAQSQGTLIGRGVVEFCDDAPPVMNFISIGGPQAGVASYPICPQFDMLCKFCATAVTRGIYTDFVQDTVALSGYIKDPNNIEGYLAKSSFLPRLNNELPHKNATYKERLTSLKNLVLIKFQEETIVTPPESSWFGFFPDNYNGPIHPLQQSRLYKEDWIGLRTLDETGRLKFVSVPGLHLLISFQDTMRYVAPYLRGTGMDGSDSSMKKRTVGLQEQP